MKVKTKNVSTGRIVEKTYRADEKVKQAIVEKSTKQFLYREGDDFIFMDNEDYTQMPVSINKLDGKEKYLKDGEDVGLLIYDNDVLDIDLPPQVQMKVTEAAPGVKGNTATGATKKVKLETGLEVEVPLFINEGERIVVDTRSGDYISRAD
jgi:elongation factor P